MKTRLVIVAALALIAIAASASVAIPTGAAFVKAPSDSTGKCVAGAKKAVIKSVVPTGDGPLKGGVTVYFKAGAIPWSLSKAQAVDYAGKKAGDTVCVTEHPSK